MFGRFLLSLATLALASLVFLALVGLWDRYSKEAERLGFSGVYERYLASQAGFPDDPIAYRAIEAERSRWQAGDSRDTAALEE
jgi:hypothetical protein